MKNNNDYTTINDISKLLNVYPVTIYRLMNNTLKTELKPHIKKRNKTIVISDEGINLIKKYLNENSTNQNPISNQNLYELLQEINYKLENVNYRLENIEKHLNLDTKNIKNQDLNINISKDKNYMTTLEASKELNVTTRTINNLIKNKKLKAEKYKNRNYIYKDDLENYKKQNIKNN